MLLCGGDADDTEESESTPIKTQELRDGFVRILELKGVKRADQASLLEMLQKRIARLSQRDLSSNFPTSLPPAAPPSNNKTVPRAVQQQDSAFSFASFKMTDAGAKLNENFKRLGSNLGSGFTIKK